jgi:D-alanine-D-alanine ligase
MNGSEGEFLERINSILTRLRAVKNDIAVLVVSCVKGLTEPQDDFAAQSLTTEFFSSNEMDHLLESLRRFGFFVKPFFSEDEFLRFLLAGRLNEIEKRYKLVYNTAHSGTGPGRKALLPCFCALHKIPFTGSDPYVVGLARHKFHVSRLLSSFGLTTPESWFFVPAVGWLEDKHPAKGSKVIAKLTYESASLGLEHSSVFTVAGDLDERLHRLAKEFRQPITVQSFVAGWEVEVPVIIAEYGFAPMAVGISKAGETLLGDAFLTYEDVYADNYGFWNFENFAGDIAAMARSSALQAAELLGFKGFARIDYRITENGLAFITDVSTSPHITKHSSYAYLFESFRRDCAELPVILAGLTCERENWI